MANDDAFGYIVAAGYRQAVVGPLEEHCDFLLGTDLQRIHAGEVVRAVGAHRFDPHIAGELHGEHSGLGPCCDGPWAIRKLLLPCLDLLDG